VAKTSLKIKINQVVVILFMYRNFLLRVEH
jgi:hypothetical protein